MRIGLDGRYIQDHYPGIGRYTYQLALALASNYLQSELYIFTSPANKNSRYDLSAFAKLPNVSLVSCPGKAFTVTSQHYVSMWCQTHPLEIFHAPHFQIPRQLSCPLVVTLHDLTPWLVPSTMPNPVTRLAFLASIGLAARRAVRVITGGECAKADLVRLLHIAASKCGVIPHGVDHAFHPLESQGITVVLTRFRLKEPYAFYCGSNKPHKNLERLISSWAMLPEAMRQSVKLVLAGPQDKRYPTGDIIARRLGIESSVTVLGECSESELVGLYNGALFFVFPSLYEGFGLPVLEALACGCPVACAGNSSLPEVAGDAALYFDPTSCDQISTAIRRLIEDQALRTTLKTRAAGRVGRYTWDNTAVATMSVYQSAIEGSQRRR